MISLEKFKELMPKDREYSEEEIVELKENMESMAQLAFEVWLENRKKSNSNL